MSKRAVIISKSKYIHMKLFLFFLLTAILPPSVQWSTDFEKAKLEATQSQKLILVNFSGSDWCVPCIKMKQEIFESDEFAEYAPEHLALVKADFPRLSKNKLSKQQTKKNEDLAAKYNPQGAFPFTVLTDANGKVLKTWDGLPKLAPAEFVNEIKDIVDERK